VALHAWAMVHGIVMISFTQVFTQDQIMLQVPAVTTNLFVGLGDTPTAARRSVRTAERRIERDPAYALPPVPELTDSNPDDNP
jgi:hypothetical protein